MDSLMTKSNLQTLLNERDNSYEKEVWPPPYSIKKHTRARNVKLKVSIQNGLEITVPKRFNHKEIPAILEENKTWIEKHLQHLQIKIAAKQAESLPLELNLHCIGKCWNICYIASNNKLQMVERPNNELALLGNIADKNGCKEILIKWIKAKAKYYLTEQLQLVSEKIQLPFKEVTFRNQQTRWGSCSENKSISLNYKLIFLPNGWTNYILIHELCHTVYLDHSEKFWRLVERYDPNWREHRLALSDTKAFIPAWIP
jgi:predicted metal-dependent hydrolase